MSFKNKLKNKFTKIIKEKVTIPIIKGNYLSNRCALITGASSGIGLEIAKSFLNNGANVIITGRNKDKLEKAKKELIESCNCKDNKVIAAVLDITKINLLKESLLEILNNSNKKVDIFVNNAGINGNEYFPNTSEEEYDKIMNTNLKGLYFISEIIVNYMVDNNIKGNILNINSSSALRPGISPYIISKWGERSLTLGMAKKYLPYGIIVNAIAPGSTTTSMLNKEKESDLYCNYSLTKRYIAPEEVANFATILVSDMGKMIVGDTIYMTGGAGILTFDDMTY